MGRHPAQMFSSADLRARFQVSYEYTVHFTNQVFDPSNPLLASVAQGMRALVVLDEGVARAHKNLQQSITVYAQTHAAALSVSERPLLVPGGEQCKNDPALLEKILTGIHRGGLDRHSCVLAVGGGAVLDLAGFAAATAHRGVRLIRIPTTVLAQNDSGVGVKNGVNAFDKKNFLGTFAPPFAVINDAAFLSTLEKRDWRAGMAEAVKVALLKDRDFFNWIEDNVLRLVERDMEAMGTLIRKCAELHLHHITRGGDSFETGSSRPLDFGHWAAHKLEQLTHYELRHGEAVAMGMALDILYAAELGLLPAERARGIISVLKRLGFQLHCAEMESKLEEPQNPHSLFAGLQEFREHLGGELTITLLREIGVPHEVHEIDFRLYRRAIARLGAE